MKIRCKYDKLLSTTDLLKVRNPINPNKHQQSQLKQLAEIMEYQGVRHPIVISNLSGLITKGHGRLQSAIMNGWLEFPVEYQDYDDADMEYYDLVADNAIAMQAEIDLAAVNLQVPNLGPGADLRMLGLKDFAIDAADKYADKDADEVPEVKESFVKLGDLWQLGSHRLLCGDSTDKSQVERLMNGERADMVYTDPPYGMNLDTNYRSMHNSDTTKNWKPVHGDDQAFDPAHLLYLCDDIFLFGADYYCQKLPVGGSWIVWDKRSSDRTDITASVEGLDRVRGSHFELCWSRLPHARAMARIVWSGGFGEGKLEERSGRNNSPVRFHPTQRPIGLALWFFDRWGKDKTNIVDLYLGSGSTLIACEKTNRRCFGMEIDPYYCSVIIERWQKFTGLTAIKL